MAVDEDEPDEIQRLLSIKDFKKFKDQVIVQYKGKKLANQLPGFEEEIISIQEDTGYLIVTSSGNIITKEESLVIWKYLYKNKHLVGKIIEEDPIKDFKNKILHINKNTVFGDKEVRKYIISDIKEELDEKEEIKYRLYIHDLEDPLQEVEKSKSLLTIEQLNMFIRENSKEN